MIKASLYQRVNLYNKSRQQNYLVNLWPTHPSFLHLFWILILLLNTGRGILPWIFLVWFKEWLRTTIYRKKLNRQSYMNFETKRSKYLKSYKNDYVDTLSMVVILKLNCSTNLRDPTSLKHFWWPFGQIQNNMTVINIEWVKQYTLEWCKVFCKRVKQKLNKIIKFFSLAVIFFYYLNSLQKNGFVNLFLKTLQIYLISQNEFLIPKQW